MLKIRLQRIGRRNDPAYRVVVAEHTLGPKSGKYVERVGSYHPKTNMRSLDAQRIRYWISVGAKPSDTLHNMLVSEGIIEGKKINVLPKKRPIEKKAAGEEAAKVKATAKSARGEAQIDEAGAAESAPERTAVPVEEKVSGEEDKSKGKDASEEAEPQENSDEKKEA